MATNSEVRQAPFKKDGGLWHYPPYSQDNLVWEPIEEWDAEMKMVGYNRGRSAAFFLWVDTEDNSSYPMFLTDMSDALKAAVIDKGVIDGTWTVVKRGMNYGLKLVSQFEEDS